MTAAITGSVASLVAQAQPATPTQTNQSQAAQTPPATSSFGDAVTVSLSAPAQAAVANQSASPTSNSSSASTTSSSPAKQTPVASQAPTVDVAQLVSAAKQKVAPQVGVSGASDVVDKNGNISKVQLTIEIAEQAQKAQKA